MKKSKLQVLSEENKITVKKRADASSCLIFAIIFIAGILFPILWEGVREFPLFWAIYAICMLGNISSFALQFFGKIVIDYKRKEISVYNLCKETYSFKDVKEIRTVFETDDPEGPDRYKVVFVCKNGYKNELHTMSKEQTEKLADLLSPILLAGDNCYDNGE